MTKFIELFAYLSVVLLVVVSNTVHAAETTPPPNPLVETLQLPSPKGGPPINYVMAKPLARSKAGKQVAITDEPALVVYIHDQGSSVKEPFDDTMGPPIALAVVLTHQKPLALIAVPAGNTWGGEPELEKITLCIRHALTIIPAKEIVLMGQQMGASISLNYAAVAPPEIKEKIIGVVGLRGIGDLAKLYEETRLVKIKNQLRVAMRGLPEDQMKRYKERSFNNHIAELGKDVKVGLILTAEDMVFPTELQEQLVKSLRRKRIAVKVIEVGGNEMVPPLKWSQGLDFCMFKGLK